MLDMHDNVPSNRSNRMMICAATIEPPSTAPKKKKAKVSPITPGTSTIANAGGPFVSMPIVVVKPAAITTPTVKQSIFEQLSPLNPYFPTLDQIWTLLLEQYFVRFEGNAKLCFQSQNNVAETLTYLWWKYDNIEYLEIHHPFHVGEDSVIYLHKCCKNHGEPCQLCAAGKFSPIISVVVAICATTWRNYVLCDEPKWQWTTLILH